MISYKYIYCAVCNEESGADLLFNLAKYYKNSIIKHDLFTAEMTGIACIN